MGINLFEGGRRLQKLLGVLWLGGAILWAWSEYPGTSLVYRVSPPDLLPQYIGNKGCGPDEFSQSEIGLTTPSGTRFDLEVCFGLDRGAMITVRQGDGRTFQAEPYSPEGSAYVDSTVKMIAGQSDPHNRADAAYWPLWRERIASAAVTGVVGIGAIILVGGVLGWLLRGFLGIQSGRDSRDN